jgi:hypothetical protein
MNIVRTIAAFLLLVFVALDSSSAQQNAKLGDNAALRYWSAFAQMQDAALTDQQVKELNGILEGSVPYDDLKYKDLVERNKPAIETMIRATQLSRCEWGVDYQLGPDAPVDYVRKALALGRLNVLYAFHLSIARDADGATRALAAGLRFSHDIAIEGTLFATVVAKDLLVTHLKAVQGVLRDKNAEKTPTAAQLAVVRKAITRLGPDGLDWQAAMKREFAIPLKLDAPASAALARIVPVYLAALSDPSVLPKLEQMRTSAPMPVPDLIPNPKRVVEEKQELINKLQEARARLQ